MPLCFLLCFTFPCWLGKHVYIQIQNHVKCTEQLLKCPYYGFLKITFFQVNENILQSFKSESAPCVKLLSLKRKSRLWIIKTSRF